MFHRNIIKDRLDTASMLEVASQARVLLGGTRAKQLRGGCWAPGAPRRLVSLTTCCCARPRHRHRHRLGLVLPVNFARRGLPPAPALRAAHPVRHRRSSSGQQLASGALIHALCRPTAHRKRLLARAGPAAPLGLASEEHLPHTCPCALMPSTVPDAPSHPCCRQGIGGSARARRRWRAARRALR